MITLPASMRVFARGWLSSNNVLLVDDACAALVDTGKYLGPDHYADMAMVAPYAVNWQIKETIGSEANTPKTDLLKLVTLIRRSGYRGYVPIETLAMRRPGYDSYIAIQQMLDELRAALTATESVTP